MKKKVYRFIDEVNLHENGNVEFEQRFNAMAFVMFGVWAFLFKNKNKFICDKSEIEKIESSSSMMTGNLITIITKDKRHILEMRSKLDYSKVINNLKNSELESKLSGVE